MKQTQHLIRGLGFRESLALVVGTIIGTGIFMKTAVMSQTVGSPSMVLLAWVFGGLLSLAGALTYAELGGLFPRAGGEMVYLQETYGRLPAFLYGWMRFWVGSPGSIAAYAVGAATFLSPLFGEGFTDAERVSVAIAFIVFFTFVNCLTVKWGGRVQVFMTILKVIMIMTIVAGCFFLSSGDGGFATPTDWQWQGWSAFGAAVIAALWAYDGWNNLPMASGEVENAQKNVPRALVLGTLIILLIYGAVNLAYFYALPLTEILTASSPSNRAALPVATKAAVTFLGASGALFLSFAFVISALGAMNGSILTSARVPFAMAEAKMFFSRLAFVHPTTKTPVIALIVQGICSCVLAISGTFDQLTDYVVFSAWVFYALCAAAVIVLRIRRPDLPRTYRVPGYPVVPVVFVLVATWLLINTLYTSPREAGVGLVIIGLGVPVYFAFFRKNANP